MEIKSTKFEDYATLTLTFKPRGEKLVNETSGGEAEAQAKFEEFVSGRLDRLLSAVVLGLEISCLLAAVLEEPTGQHQDAPSEVDAPQQPHDDDIQNPGE